MQKIRVSPMRIVKKDGQTTQAPTGSAVTIIKSKQKESLQSRLRKIAKERMRSIPSALPKMPQGRRTVTHRPKRPSGKPDQQRPWRYDVALQAAVCLVILVSAVTFQAIDTPVTNRITDGLSHAVTMEVDISDNLGRLQFVRNIMPESVLTFWNATADGPENLVYPLKGKIVIAYSADQPGILLRGTENAVYSAADGEILSVTKGQEGDYILRIEHDGSMQTLYGFLQGVKVAPGDRVYAGQEVGLAMPASDGFQLYFQTFSQDKPIDPAPMFLQ